MHHGNDDAGDCRAFGMADYSAEMSANSASARRADFIEAFDCLTASGFWIGSSHASGPNPRPTCDECETLLERETQGVWNDNLGQLFCSETCDEDYDESMGGYYFDDPQEDFRADLGIGPSDPYDPWD